MNKPLISNMMLPVILSPDSPAIDKAGPAHDKDVLFSADKLMSEYDTALAELAK